MMTPKSVAYMVVAVFLGYALVSAVPSQMSMFATPSLSGEVVETATSEELAFVPENESLPPRDFAGGLEDVAEAEEAASARAEAASESADEAIEMVHVESELVSGQALIGTLIWFAVAMVVASVVYWFARLRLV